MAHFTLVYPSADAGASAGVPLCRWWCKEKHYIYSGVLLCWCYGTLALVLVLVQVYSCSGVGASVLLFWCCHNCALVLVVHQAASAASEAGVWCSGAVSFAAV